MDRLQACWSARSHRSEKGIAARTVFWLVHARGELCGTGRCAAAVGLAAQVLVTAKKDAGGFCPPACDPSCHLCCAPLRWAVVEPQEA
jgi:hypothetical protein